MDSAEQTPPDSGKAQLTQEQKTAKRERELLLLARTNLARQLEATTNERHIEALKHALHDLDEKISAFD